MKTSERQKIKRKLMADLDTLMEKVEIAIRLRPDWTLLQMTNINKVFREHRQTMLKLLDS